MCANSRQAPHPVWKKILGYFRPGEPPAALATAPLETVLRGIPEAAFVLDAVDRVLLANEKGHALMASRAHAHASLAARLGSAALLAALQSRHGEDFRDPAAPRLLAEFAMHRSPYPDLWFTGSITPLPTSPTDRHAAPRRLVILIDITRHKSLENVQRDFIANISHDLRTPIAILKGYADALHDDYDKLDDSERRHFAARLYTTTQRLNHLLESMTQMALLEKTVAPDSLKCGVLNAMLSEAADLFADRFATQNVQLELALHADDSTVAVSPGMLMNVAVNLLENALKHGGPVLTKIRLSSETLPGGGAAIEVADDGAGVAGFELSRIFERFFRGDKSRTQVKGLGLGLSMVKHIISLHGGTVLARPSRPCGLVVRIELLPESRAPDAPGEECPSTVRQNICQ